jgi:type IX secretion system PorP/SprF family membrane protein
MKWFKRITLFAVGLMAFQSLGAQDIHFSQFYMSPLNLNPAMTGVIGCEMRFGASYRNQWASVLKSNAFTTYSASFDTRLNAGRYDFVGLGGTLWADRVGSAAFSTIQGFVSGSYLKRLGGLRANESYLVVGAQLGITQRDINVAELIYGDQWDGENGSVPFTAETPFDPNFIFADMGAGILYYTFLNRQKSSNFYAGLAFHHLNRANMSFTRRELESLYTKFTLHLGGEFMFGNQRVGIVPALLFHKQGPSFQTNVGTSVKFRLSKDRQARQAFSVGGYVRISGKDPGALHSDAAIFTGRFDFSDFSLGLSYDLNVSSATAATNGNGGFELAMMYRLCKDRKRRMSCPDF